MHSTEVQAKPLFSWKALGWALLYFWFFSTLLQAIIYISGYSGTNGIRDSLLFSSLWLIPVFLFPKRIKIIAAVIGVVLWAASLAALCYYVIYGQEFSQDVDRKYSLAELIHTWSDLAGLSYDGYDPTRSVVNPQFKENTRWIGNPYKKNALIDYDTLPYGDQVGNQ
ncbi:hypothetical protein ACPX1F_004434 [Escherichia coli]